MLLRPQLHALLALLAPSAVGCTELSGAGETGEPERFACLEFATERIAVDATGAAAVQFQLVGCSDQPQGDAGTPGSLAPIALCGESNGSASEACVDPASVLVALDGTSVSAADLPRLELTHEVTLLIDGMPGSPAALNNLRTATTRIVDSLANTPGVRLGLATFMTRNVDELLAPTDRPAQMREQLAELWQFLEDLQDELGSCDYIECRGRDLHGAIASSASYLQRTLHDRQQANQHGIFVRKLLVVISAGVDTWESDAASVARAVQAGRSREAESAGEVVDTRILIWPTQAVTDEQSTTDHGSTDADEDAPPSEADLLELRDAVSLGSRLSPTALFSVVPPAQDGELPEQLTRFVQGLQDELASRQVLGLCAGAGEHLLQLSLPVDSTLTRALRSSGDGAFASRVSAGQCELERACGPASCGGLGCESCEAGELCTASGACVDALADSASLMP